MSTHLIKLNDVGKNYITKKFTIEIKPNDFLLVSGSNGTGKTTLMMLILGFIHPDSGVIEKKKIKMGFLPEKVMLPPLVDVWDYLKTMARIKKDVIDMDLLHTLEIPVDKKIYELSKGNQQKLAMMTAFMGHPHLTVLDEPLSGLDDVMKEKVVEIIKSYYRMGHSILLSTHEPEQFYDVATKKVIL